MYRLDSHTSITKTSGCPCYVWSYTFSLQNSRHFSHYKAPGGEARSAVFRVRALCTLALFLLSSGYARSCAKITYVKIKAVLQSSIAFCQRKEIEQLVRSARKKSLAGKLRERASEKSEPARRFHQLESSKTPAEQCFFFNTAHLYRRLRS